MAGEASGTAWFTEDDRKRLLGIDAAMLRVLQTGGRELLESTVDEMVARFYTRVAADVYFDTEEAAERAGFIRFDRRSSSAHVSLRPETLR